MLFSHSPLCCSLQYGEHATDLKEAKMMVKYFHHNSIMQSICISYYNNGVNRAFASQPHGDESANNNFKLWSELKGFFLSIWRVISIQFQSEYFYDSIILHLSVTRASNKTHKVRAKSYKCKKNIFYWKISLGTCGDIYHLRLWRF